MQMRYVERAPGCADPPPVPFQHRKTQRKSAPKPGTAEEARHQAEQQKKLAQVLQNRCFLPYIRRHTNLVALGHCVLLR